LEGKFTGGVHRYGLENQGVDYTLDTYNEKIFPPSVKERVEKVKSEIISGKIHVPDYYKNSK
jgi:basic membrane protein A